MNEREAIERIRDHMKVHRIGEYLHIKLAEALNMAISALRAQAAPPPNDPLTLEELRRWMGSRCGRNTTKLGGSFQWKQVGNGGAYRFSSLRKTGSDARKILSKGG